MLHKRGTQRAQYPLIKESSLDHKKDPFITQAIFPHEGVLGSLGNETRSLHHLRPRFAHIKRRTFLIFLATPAGIGSVIDSKKP